METKAERLDALDAEFNSYENCRTGEITLDGYIARRKLIEARPEPQQPAPTVVKNGQPSGQKFITRGFLERVLGHVGGSLGKAINEKLDPLEARIKALEQKQLKYCNVYRDGETYEGNSLVTFQGALWICKLISTKEKPGTSDAWQMMHKTR